MKRLETITMSEAVKLVKEQKARILDEHKESRYLIYKDGLYMRRHDNCLVFEKLYIGKGNL